MSDLFVDITLPNNLTYKQPIGLFINNEFVPAQSGEFINSINPASDEVITKVHAAGPEDVDIAVKHARAAFKAWKKFDGSDRRDLFLKLASLIERDYDLIAAIEANDSGKPLDNNARFDVDETLEVIKYLAGWTDKIQGRTIPTTSKKFAYTIMEPIGVCGLITPFNYPLAMSAWKLASLASGNCAIYKSSEYTPLSILYVVQLFKEAGFPPGVIQVLSGSGAVAGDALVKHLGVDKIAFTGSTFTARKIQSNAAINLKPVTIEAGGKTPVLVFDDCDFDEAVAWSAIGIFSNMGQICTGSSRIYVQETIYEKFLSALKVHVEKEYPQGLPFEADVVVGPQVSKVQYEKILGYIKAGKEEGARVILGGDIPSRPELQKGYFIQPTIFADVKPHFKIVQEEIFGPVVSIAPFKTEEEAVQLANDTVYGLGASIFTKDITRATLLAQDLESGMVWINSNNDSDCKVPFGGVKLSGHGRELGQYGVETFMAPKAVHVNLGNNLTKL